MTGTPPTPDIFDAPGISVCINAEWASFIDARVAQLLDRDLWQGTDLEIDRAVDQVNLFLAKLGDVGACALTPIGATMMWITSTPPDGWLILDGAALLADDYPELFDLIGYTYGGGSGTFFIPDLRGLSPMGAGGFVGLMVTTGNTQSVIAHDNLPNVSFPVTDPGHIHTVTDPGHVHLEQNGASPAYLATGGTGRVGFGAVTTNSTTRVTSDSATTGVSVNSHSTGISVNSGGLDQGLDIVHPVVGVHYIIFAGH